MVNKTANPNPNHHISTFKLFSKNRRGALSVFAQVVLYSRKLIAESIMNDRDLNSIYKWEQNANRSWETVREDAAGNITVDASSRIENEKRRSHRAKEGRVTQSIRRGLIRYLVVAMDCSAASAELDSAYRPYGCRLEATKAATQKFVIGFYDQNPISNLGLILTRDRVAGKLQLKPTMPIMLSPNDF